MSFNPSPDLLKPSVQLRKGESWQQVYVAKQEGSAPNEFKAGKTRVAPGKRVQGMGGQGDKPFHMLAVFLTLDCGLAEELAFAKLDAMGARKYPNTRKELFLGTFEELCEVMSSAAAEANRLTRLDPLRQALLAQDKAAAAPTHRVRHKSKFWEEAMRAPVTLFGKQVELGVLLGLAVTDSKAAARAEQLGFQRVGVAPSKVDFRVKWLSAGAVLKWLKSRGFTDASLFSPTVQFNVSQARPA